MKKTLITLMTALSMSGSLLAAPAVLAADRDRDQLQLKDQTCVEFVDANKDGICDNYLDHEPLMKQDGTGNRGGYRQVIDEDNLLAAYRAERMMRMRMNRPGSAMQGNAGSGAQGTGQAGNFVDKDNDEVCDNYEDRDPILKQDGTGRTGTGGAQAGSGTKSGTGSNYQDSNSDGVCDNYETREPILKQDGTGGNQGGSGMRRGR